MLCAYLLPYKLYIRQYPLAESNFTSIPNERSTFIYIRKVIAIFVEPIASLAVLCAFQS